VLLLHRLLHRMALLFLLLLQLYLYSC